MKVKRLREILDDWMDDESEVRIVSGRMQYGIRDVRDSFEREHENVLFIVEGEQNRDTPYAPGDLATR